MTRTALPYSAPDLSTLARLLERALDDHLVTHGRLPGHVEMMNLLARGAGRRNLQEYKARIGHPDTPLPDELLHHPEVPDFWFDAPELPDQVFASALPEPPPTSDRAAKTLKCFDFSSRLVRWPPKLSQQRLALWVLWTRFDARRTYAEAEVNRVLKAWHTYGDHATLRRELINHQFMTRKDDCSEYRKLQQLPDDEAQGLLRALRKRQAPHRLSRRPPRVLSAAAGGHATEAENA
jgi:hypothetical protein